LNRLQPVRAPARLFWADSDYGSNQGRTWTKIAALESTAEYGWNVVKVNGEPSYRYLKVANETNGVALSEIEIYGTVSTAGNS